jgi:putative DeoR family transcriptional regulator (stage III sporulation protein D)
MINNLGKERAELIGQYVLETSATVRATASVFGISKSTVHKDLTEKLKYINPFIYDKVKHVLEKNKNERHLRGGEATRQKYILKKQRKNRE